MKLISTYPVGIKHYSHIFKATAEAYRRAVDFFIEVCMQEWTGVAAAASAKERVNAVERLTVATKKRPRVKYSFASSDKVFYKFPSYLRRAAISEAIGKVSSYQSNLKNWEDADQKARGRKPGVPKAGFVYPAMYKDNMYERTGQYSARIKVWIRNTWDWLEVSLRKSDADYIERYCRTRQICAPTLQKRGKKWFLDFSFKEEAALSDTPLAERTIVSVDLGVNSPCTCSVMRADGTVIGRHFLKLPVEEDSLSHALNRLKKAQSLGARRTPRLWASVKGINRHISAKTAQFIMDTACLYNADVIVFEALDVRGKKRGGKKQRLHHWRADYVQRMVTDKAHRLGMRISRICAWNTSKLAYDGSGYTERGAKAGFNTYSICRFQTGKVYNCDLNASYNIGARYLIREILAVLPETARMAVQAEVPELARRTTCTLSSLWKLDQALASIIAA